MAADTYDMLDSGESVLGVTRSFSRVISNRIFSGKPDAYRLHWGKYGKTNIHGLH